MKAALRNYAIVTGAYWAFTVTDGALRMLVLLHFNQLGYAPVELAFLFLLYEFFGIATNLIGGWLAARVGLKATLTAGLALQVVALFLLSLLGASWMRAASVAWVMGAQALSGIAKDLTKMSAKSAVKRLVPTDASSTLFRWVAALTGSKNALKGVGFFVGGALLGWLGFRASLWAMAMALTLAGVLAQVSLPSEMGRAKARAKFTELFAKSRAVNVISAARFFLFGARDIWFVVGVPVFLSVHVRWGFAKVGSFLALWVIGYGVVQSIAPSLLGRTSDRAPGARTAQLLAFLLAAVTGVVAAAVAASVAPSLVILLGLGVFGCVFALNSSIHSYLILAYSDADDVATNVGFYYMANAGGRLVGTLLSGVLYQVAGLAGCLWGSAAFALAAGGLSLLLPAHEELGSQS